VVPFRRHPYSTLFPYTPLFRSGGCMLLGLIASMAIVEPARADEPVREVRHDPTAYPPPKTRLPVVAVVRAPTAAWYGAAYGASRSEEHTPEPQARENLVCRLLL